LRRRRDSGARPVAPALCVLLLAAGCGPIVTTTPAPVEPFRAVVRVEPPTLVAPPTQPAVRPRAPLPEGTRIGMLAGEACFAELDRAGVRYQRLPGPVPGIALPMRLAGPVGGITYRSSARSQDSPYTLLDCRLARVLVELSAILRPLGVVEVIHYSMHRPGKRGRASEGGGTGHYGGLAIDAATFRRAEGGPLNILKHFAGRRHAPVCGPKAAAGATAEARALRQIVCRSDERRLFHVLLTPNHDRAHRNHFHMEVRPDGVKWFLLK
jgi:hypothetical protein